MESRRYHKAVWVLAMAFALLVIADSVITWWAVNHGYTELNPLGAMFAHTRWFAAVKILVSALYAGWVIWMTGRFTKVWHPAPIVLFAFSLILVGLMAFVVISNLILIWF